MTLLRILKEKNRVKTRDLLRTPGLLQNGSYPTSPSWASAARRRNGASHWPNHQETNRMSLKRSSTPSPSIDRGAGTAWSEGNHLDGPYAPKASWKAGVRIVVRHIRTRRCNIPKNCTPWMALEPMTRHVPVRIVVNRSVWNWTTRWSPAVLRNVGARASRRSPRQPWHCDIVSASPGRPKSNTRVTSRKLARRTRVVKSSRVLPCG